MNSLSAVLLDFDGVILDSSLAKTEAFLEFYGRFPECSEEMKSFHLKNKGITRDEQFKYMAHLLGKDTDEKFLTKLLTDFGNFVVDRILACDRIEGIDKFIEYFNNDKIPLHVISNAPHEELMRIVEKENLIDSFKSITGSTRDRKKTAALSDVIQNEGYDRGKVIYIGDTMGDYKASQDNGIDFIGLNNCIVNFVEHSREICAFNRIGEIQTYLIKNWCN